MDMKRALREFAGNWGGRLGDLKLVMAADRFDTAVVSTHLNG